MSGYNRDRKTFILTAMKMEHYHRNHPHASFPRDVCPICHAQYGQEYMEPAAAFFRANGFDVVDVGDAHITIAAPSKPRKKFGMWITKETDDLYQLLAGRIEAQPDSLPRLVNFEENDGHEFDESTFRPSLEIERPITRLQNWLHDLMEQKHVELRQTREHPTKTRPIIVCESEIAIIQRVQDKIQELLEHIERVR